VRAANADEMGWANQAACRDLDPSWFFFDGGCAKAFTARARAVCDTCPVQVDCLEYAIVNRVEHGIWGGVGEKERKKIRTARNRTRRAAAIAARRSTA
jgi:WhiB family redox-sensing transcriptional regulator